MSEYRKLGRTSGQRKALLRNQVTALLYHGKIKTTETKAKEIRKIAEKLITLAVKEKDNYTEVTVTQRVPKKIVVEDKVSGKHIKRDKEVIDGKKVTKYEEVQKVVKKDNPSRLNARRKMLQVLYPVTEVPAENAKKKVNSKQVNLVDKLFDEIAPKYVDRKGGYTRAIKLGMRKGDAAEVVILELV